MSVEKLETERLRLREITADDANFIVSLRADEKVYRYFTVPKKITIAEHLDWYNNSYLSNPERIDLIALEKESGEKVGIYGIKLCDGKVAETHAAQGKTTECTHGSEDGSIKSDKINVDKINADKIKSGTDVNMEINDCSKGFKVIEVSYITADRYKGKGYASEAVAAAMAFGQKLWKCDIAMATIHPENEASVKFAEHNGFELAERRDGFKVFIKQL